MRGSWPDEGSAQQVVVGSIEVGQPPVESAEDMTEVIAGVEIPETAAVAEASRLIQETTSPLIYHHSRRVFFFGQIHAHRLGVAPDPELLYLAAMFHDAGLATPFSEVEQRFEVDGADHGRRFLLERGFSAAAADTVWTAIALHTTPGIPDRMGPEIATTYLGVLTDVLGFGLDGLNSDQVEEVLAVHPRGDFKNEFLRAYHDGMKNRPDTTNGTVNSDVLEHFVPDFRRTTTVERILGSAWPS
ncbi:HD domain-containing protein [Pseudonocardia halophobica]|uniref:HD domain-containing protein n=1 Tax=Pseudonocardia halophobica TaxID=29401 RepID=UPI000AE24229|nr:HD domain-containing protein [Pseudonocardia halophobica]